jgi:hypothetical protein
MLLERIILCTLIAFPSWGALYSVLREGREVIQKPPGRLTRQALFHEKFLSKIILIRENNHRPSTDHSHEGNFNSY